MDHRTTVKEAIASALILMVVIIVFTFFVDIRQKDQSFSSITRGLVNQAVRVVKVPDRTTTTEYKDVNPSVLHFTEETLYRKVDGIQTMGQPPTAEWMYLDTNGEVLFFLSYVGDRFVQVLFQDRWVSYEREELPKELLKILYEKE